MKLKKNKRAIAPLVSTILLIVFASLLGAIVMSWGKSQKAVEEVSCKELEFTLIKIGKEPCYDSNSIYITYENSGIKSVNAAQMTILYSDRTKLPETTDLKELLDVGQIKRSKLDYKEKSATPSLIRIEPIIINGEKKNICPKSGIDIPLSQC